MLVRIKRVKCQNIYFCWKKSHSFLPCFIFISGYWIAIESYTARSEDELSYRAGDEVEVLSTSNLGWWKIR